MTWSTPGRLFFEYLVDAPDAVSGLQVLLDGSEVMRLSGHGRFGTTSIAVPSGQHTVRFAYLSGVGPYDGVGRATVDDIRQTDAAGQPVQFEFFNGPLGAIPSLWTTGGASGGWRIDTSFRPFVIRRDEAIAHAGYQPVPRVAAIERTFVWPSGGSKQRLSLEYFVDSEQDKDTFRVLVDGVERGVVSGRGRLGDFAIPIATAGPHTVRLEYRKDESVDEGFDDAMLLSLRVESDGQVIESLAGLTGVSGGALTGWQVPADADFGWVLSALPPRRTFVHPFETGAPPETDGQVLKDYPKPTRIRLPAILDGQRRGELWVARRAPDGTLFLGLRLDDTINSGELTVYVDAAHDDALAGRGCPGSIDTPGPAAAKIVLGFDVAGGSTVLGQHRGTCNPSAPWGVSAPGQNWLAQVVAGAPAADPGFTHVEIAMTPPAGSPEVTATRLGLGLLAASAGQVFHRLPLADGLGPLDASVTSLQSLRFYPKQLDLQDESERWMRADGESFETP